MFLAKCRLPGCDSLLYLVLSPIFSDRHFLGVPVFLGAMARLNLATADVIKRLIAGPRSLAVERDCV
jgi:hypothetical protein